jgi:hypothetical protein
MPVTNFLGTLGPTIISIGALVSIFGTLNVIMLACTRLPFAMAAQGQFWREARDVSVAVAIGLLIYAGTRIGRRSSNSTESEV